MDKTVRISRHINPTIKKGDLVRLVDGSALTCCFNNEHHLIIKAYPSITGSNLLLKNMDAVVLMTGVQDVGSYYKPLDHVYIQDIIIQLGNARYRTCSRFVSLVKIDFNKL